jgi:hypothetical protein
MFEGWKMAGRDTSFPQSAATEFLVKQEIPTSDGHARLQSVKDFIVHFIRQ